MRVDEKTFWVYIVASRSHTLYTGVTSNIEKRVWQHKDKTFEGFSCDYNCNRLVWFERYSIPEEAFAREKQIKRWARKKKVFIIEMMNPTWADLSEEWGKPIALFAGKGYTGPSTA